MEGSLPCLVLGDPLAIIYLYWSLYHSPELCASALINYLQLYSRYSIRGVSEVQSDNDTLALLLRWLLVV